jgi:hypothetical protein
MGPRDRNEPWPIACRDRPLTAGTPWGGTPGYGVPMEPRSIERRLRRFASRVLTPDQRLRIKELEATMHVPRGDDLDALALHFGTDKSSAGHNYTPLYERHFASRRLAVTSLLEIGVGGTSSIDGYETSAGGQSLQMWSRYLPHAEILGIDIHHKAISGPRIHFEQGNASDRAFLERVIGAYGPFDIVIDDGSHIGRDILPAFETLWPAVKPGGLYVIEDLSLAYHADWEGGPPGTPGTVVDLIKRLVDDTLIRAGDSFRPSVGELHLYSEIVFLQAALS